MRWLRFFFDDVMALLLLGVSVFAILYLIWGIMEVASVTPLPEIF